MLDRFQHSFVVVLAPLRAAFDQKNPCPLLAQKAYDGIDQRQNQRIRGSFGKRFLLVAPPGASRVIPFTVVLNWAAGLKK